MAQITGHIIQANGTPISEAIITVTAKQHSSVIGGDILKGTSFDVVCGTDGSYSFPLAVGSYSIQVKTGRTIVSLDGVVIDNNTPNGIDILGLIAYQGVSVTLAQQILNDATALSNAQATAVMSAVKANDGVGSGLDADLFQGQTLAQVLAIYPSMDTGWLPLTLLNGWVARNISSWSGPNGVPSYRRLPDGGVEIRGQVVGTAFTNGLIFANLPAGFRPVSGYMVHGVMHPASRIVLEIHPNGNIMANFLDSGGSASPNAFVSLNCSFLTE